MTSGPDDRSPKGVPPTDKRKARLAKQLRANLARRKEQSRAKRAGASDVRPEGLGAAPAATEGDDPGAGET